MRVKTKSSITITLISFFIILVLGIFLWLFLYKGIQQDKTYSGAKYVRQRVVGDMLL